MGRVVGDVRIQGADLRVAVDQFQPGLGVCLHHVGAKDRFDVPLGQERLILQHLGDLAPERLDRAPLLDRLRQGVLQALNRGLHLPPGSLARLPASPLQPGLHLARKQHVA